MRKLFSWLKARIDFWRHPTPDGIWCGDPWDCVVFTTPAHNYWHEPFVCNGNCSYGWKRGVIDFHPERIRGVRNPIIFFDE